MSEIAQYLKTAPNDRSGPAKPITIEYVEELWKKIQELPRRSEIVESGVVSPNNVEEITAQIRALKMGLVPDNLTGEIREAWNLVKDEWSCQSILYRLRADLKRLLEPVQKSANDIKQLEQEIEVDRSRLETLQMLVHLLDELVKTERAEADDAKVVLKNPAAQT